MSSNFWASSHYNHWIVDRITVRQSREDDLKYATAADVGMIAIFFANVIAKLGKRLNVRAQIVATAIVYFKRFYLKNSYCDTDPYLLVPTCLYVATKIEEVPLHFKPIATDCKTMYVNDYDLRIPMPDAQQIAEMEFYLLEDLDFHLIVHHPYRTLMQLCGESSASRAAGESEEGEAGETGLERERFWSTGKGGLQLEDEGKAEAWHIINDTLRGDFCLTYHPHLIAIAAIFLTLVTDPSTRDRVDPLEPLPRYATRSKAPADPPPDPVEFLAALNVSYTTISQIVQEILDLWSLWGRNNLGETGGDRKGLREVTHKTLNYGVTDDYIIKKVASMQQSRKRDEMSGVKFRLFDKPKPPKPVKK